MPSVALRRRVTAPELALGAFALVSAAAFLRADGAWALMVLPVLGLVLTLEEVGDGLRGGVERLAWLATLLSALAGFAWTLFFVVDEEQIVAWRGTLGIALLVLSAVFLAGNRAWSPPRGLVPVCLALLMLAAIGPGERITLPLALAALALLAWLASQRPAAPGSGARASRSPVPLMVFVASVVALAAGIVSALPIAQPLVERATREFLLSQGTSGLSESGSLGAVSEMGLSREIVLRMWSDGPGLMRARVHTDFDGRGWTSTPAGTRRLEPTTAPLAAGVAELLDDLPGQTYSSAPGQPSPQRAMKVLLARAGRGWIVTPPGARTVRITGGAPTIDDTGVLKAPFNPPPTIYGLAYGSPDAASLAAAERTSLLAVPEVTDPRLVQLAEQIREGAQTDRERVAATVAALAECCTYALDVGAFTTDQPVAEFLFDKRRGYCEYFASAAAVLLRLQGIPTRYVTGLSVQPESRRGDHYLVRASDAHAWIDVWLEGEGWVEVDPTPASQYAALRAGLSDGWARRAWERVGGLLAEWRARVSTDWRAALGWAWGAFLALVTGVVGRLGTIVTVTAALAALAGVAALIRRRLSRREPHGRSALSPADLEALPPEVARLVSRLEELWSLAGHPRPAHRGQLEHLRALDPGALGPELAESSRAVVDCYYRVRFGGREAEASEIARLLGALEAVGGA